MPGAGVRALQDAAARIPKLAAEAKSAAIAGYLPAPAEPRFISAAEEAAKKLPPSIKAESLKNTLIKGGAKPIELEYAGIDRFLADRKGQRVAASDVLQHIEREGPLGQMGRVDQRPPNVEEALDGLRGSKKPIPRLANIRKPFGEDAAYPDTVYSSNTEQGMRGDTSGYREVLFADPKNPDRLRDVPLGIPAISNRFTMQQPGPVDAHDSDYWIRYHNNPNEIAVQNIQSDIGQRISKDGSNRGGEMRGINRRLDELYALEDYLLDQPDGYPGKLDGLNELNSSIRDVFDYGQDGLEIVTGPDGRPRFAEPQQEPVSPLSRDDKWKDFLARQIVLEAAAQGKPITLPTADNASRAEFMPTHAAAAFYERDFPSRIMKVLKEFDPQGGGGSTTFVPDVRVELTSGPKPYALHYGLTNGIGKAVITPDVSEQMRRLLNVAPPYIPDRLNAPEYAAAIQGKQDDLWEAARSGGLSAAQIEDARNLGVLYGLLERSPARLPVRQRRGPAADSPRPGTHIQMTPIARRSILERGMPILSVGGLLGGLTSRNEESR